MELESLVDQSHGSTDDLAHQLPTPRSSLSSGASSPPENVSPTAQAPAPAHPHSPTHTRAQQPQPSYQQHAHTNPSHHTLPIHLTSSLTSTPPSRTDLQSATAPPIIHHASSNNNISNTQAPYTRSPLGYQTQPFASFRSSSPVLSSKLGPALVIPPPSSALAEGASMLQSNTFGSSLHTMHGGGVGGVMSMTTATSPTAATLGGRSHFQAQLQQLNSEIQQQQQHQHQQHQLHLEQERLLEDEREMQKKNARSAISSVSAFLPPALNQSLTKVVQSAKDVVNPMASHSKLSLPSTRLSTITESSSSNSGMGGVGTGASSSSSAYAPRSRLRLSPRTIWHAIKLPVICLCWYMSSAVTNNIGKQIMNQFRYPVTLTFVQFWFVSVFCFVAGVGFNMTKMRKPTRAIVELTAPLVGFQVVGHVFSSVAISRVPLSVVHTVKALTPLFTVLFYRVVLGTTYSQAVYLSLVPLTAGVMLACRMSLEFNNMVGLCCALLSTLVFVMQNVFTKKILSSGSKAKSQQQGEHHGMGGLGNNESIATESGSGEGSGGNQKLDKINILFYSSTMAAVCMIPMWLYTEGWTLMFAEDPLGRAEGSTGTWAVISWLLFLNGVSHFFQNFLAFSVLALTSPVTYSIASLIKRIVVIIASIVYFHQTLGTTQWTGVCLTFWGLWMYNSAKNAAKVNPASGILASTKVGRRMSRGFTRGLLDAEMESGSSSRSKAGFMV
ncbi:suppressor of loss of ypt1 [Mortierella alpina]|uniref:Suppressor of loss of ypt1 n=1 Tax=Mortierella alpina TaxID=64518 RepID=A0A9P6J2G0_MORAP|nr:suppressor of loss of ypt1 [Mortierella alpina]